MDILYAWICMFFAFIAIIIISLKCCWFYIVYCKTFRKKEDAKQAKFKPPPVVVTSVTTTAPGGYQMSAGGYPAQVYTAPYPTTGAPHGMVAVAMPMPPQFQPQRSPGVHSQMVPYPPVGVQPGQSMNPPSYDVVVGQGSGVPLQSGAPIPYEKQAAYNPNYAPQ